MSLRKSPTPTPKQPTHSMFTETTNLFGMAEIVVLVESGRESAWIETGKKKWLMNANEARMLLKTHHDNLGYPRMLLKIQEVRGISGMYMKKQEIAGGG